MSREAPELCKSDVLSSSLGRPTAWQERGRLFSFYPPSLGNAKRTSVGVCGGGTALVAPPRGPGAEAAVARCHGVCSLDDADGDV